MIATSSAPHGTALLKGLPAAEQIAAAVKDALTQKPAETLSHPMSSRGECLPDTPDVATRGLPTSSVSTAVAGAMVNEYEPKDQAHQVTAPVIGSETAPKPEEITDYARFKATHWVDENGSCEPAPWLDAAFMGRLEECFSRALSDIDFPMLWLSTRCMETMGGKPALGSAEIGVIQRLWSSGSIDVIDGHAERVAYLRGQVDSLDETASLQFRLRCLLVAIHPVQDQYFAKHDQDDLIEAAGFHYVPLRNTISALLRLRQQTTDPIGFLRQHLHPEKLQDPVQTEKSLEAARTGLRDLVAQNRVAAGGRVQRTHCREAWAAFMEKIVPDLQQLFPVTKGGALAWDTLKLRDRLVGWSDIFEKIMAHYGARYVDLKKMERTYRNIRDSAYNVNRWMEQKKAANARTTSAATEILPADEIRDILAPKQKLSSDENFCCRLLDRLLRPDEHEDSSSMDLVFGDVFKHPQLLSEINILPAEVLQGDLGQPVLLVTSSDDPLRLMAILLMHPASYEDGTSVESLKEELHRMRRTDLEDRLLPAMSEREQQNVQTAREELIGSLLEEADLIYKDWQDLDQLAAPEATQINELCKDSREVTQCSGRVGFEVSIVRAWLQYLKSCARRSLLAALHQMQKTRDKISQGVRTQFDKAIQNGHYAEALLLCSERQSSESSPVRETLWRPEAATRWQHPAAAVASDPSDLAKQWMRGISGGSHQQTSDRRLRTLFAEYVLAAELHPNKHLYDCRDRESSTLKFESKLIRQCIGAQRLNPSFLPQLADFSAVVILTPTIATDNPLIVRHIAEQTAIYKHELCVVLVPKLAETKRLSLQQELRKRDNKVAVIDDLDLCRIIAPGMERKPNPLIGFFEIAFEQQKWPQFDPFQTEDGQRMRMEMFVGRRVEASELTMHRQYSRVFSGRKLGKSALLKYINQALNDERMPSGNLLKVVYVPIVGAFSEVDLVERIFRGLKEDLNWTEPYDGRHPDPGDRLVYAMREFAKQSPTTNLLLVLDEADNFVEGELERYEARRGRCLSFRMRSEIEDRVDTLGHPRVRFVFAGYRRTNVNAGAWANWGDVLRLDTLDPQDAASLVEGPLARLGIDVSKHAGSIAYRCGYQPAVLMKVGKLLLSRAQSHRSTTQWEYVALGTEDVAAVFNDFQVQDEIRQIVNNNFTQNRREKIIFYTALLELSEMPFGAELDSAEDRIFDRLKEIDPEHETKWLLPHEPDEVSDVAVKAEITYQLRELVQRRLLVASRDGRSDSYRLRFPHHLSVLRQNDPVTALQSELRAVRHSAESAAVSISNFCILSRSDAEYFKYVFDADPQDRLGIQALVAVSHWSQPLIAKSGGIPDFLQIDPSGCIRGDQVIDQAAVNREKIAVFDCSSQNASLLLAGRRPDLKVPLLLGGPELLRWALANRMNVEIATVRRFKVHDLAWWFERIRGLELPGTEALNHILRLTSGIPALVGAIDSWLVGDGEGGVSIGTIKLEELERSFDTQIKVVAQEMLGGSPAQCLTAREVEIMRMVTAVGPAKHLIEDLTEYWDGFYAEKCPVSALTELDSSAVGVLQGLGILPVDRSKSAASPLDCLKAIQRDDALYRIVAALGEHVH